MSVELIDVPKGPAPGRSWLEQRPHLTEANPKQTLFGTTLQRRDKSLCDDLRNLNLKEYEAEKARSQKGGVKMPEIKAVCTPDLELLSEKRRTLADHQKQSSNSERYLSTMEEQSRYFKVQSAGDTRQPVRERSKRSQKMTEADLEHALEINTVGLGKNGSYNHHKYGNKPPVHQYCLVGDPLAKGMDFTEVADKPNHMVPKMQPFKRHRDPYEVPRDQYMMRGDCTTKGVKVVLEDGAIPANIQHQFGTQVCQMLLADPEKVKQTIERQRYDKEVSRRPHKPMARVAVAHENLDPSYKELGNSTRSNILGPTMTCNHFAGEMKSNFNDEVHRRRVPETDEYKYQRDELSQWWEHETLRGLLKKKWDEWDASRPRFIVNWDRNAKRPPPPPKPKEPKPKPKPKPKPAELKAPTPLNDVVFEDIEFKTPPLTPPVQPPPPPIPAAKMSEEDDDFWNFYDQGVPLP